CKFLLDDGTRKDIIELNTPNTGLFISGLIWREMYDFSKDCVLMVLADNNYDESDYIRNYDKFLEVVS
ncbi:MAG: WxcM-like domain-containing protein, partial [Campylobacterota bacterium]|nr:WxcM-like domain-containing protein [Campylobacterota bacterium]